MKLIIERCPGLQEIEVSIRHDDQEKVERIVEVLNFDTTIIGRRDEHNYPLVAADILYFESVDEKVFAYDESEVYQIRHRLYELDNMLNNAGFSRISISVIVNRRKIVHFKSSFNGRLEAQLTNGEKLLVSRSYVKELKQALGGDRT